MYRAFAEFKVSHCCRHVANLSLEDKSDVGTDSYKLGIETRHAFGP